MIRSKSIPCIKNEKGFTLVELLIVVIILAVLAAIVIPQFTSSTDEAKDAALKSTLAEMRNAVELYYHQHNSTYPGANKALDGSAGGTITDFEAQLTLYTNVSGQTVTTKTGLFKYGPYLKKSVLPTNPIDDSASLVFNTLTPGDITATGTDAGGWWFDTTSGKFLANILAYYTY